MNRVWEEKRRGNAVAVRFHWKNPLLTVKLTWRTDNIHPSPPFTSLHFTSVSSVLHFHHSSSQNLLYTSISPPTSSVFIPFPNLSFFLSPHSSSAILHIILFSILSSLHPSTSLLQFDIYLSPPIWHFPLSNHLSSILLSSPSFPHPTSSHLGFSSSSILPQLPATLHCFSHFHLSSSLSHNTYLLSSPVFIISATSLILSSHPLIFSFLITSFYSLLHPSTSLPHLFSSILLIFHPSSTLLLLLHPSIFLIFNSFLNFPCSLPLSSPILHLNRWMGKMG